MAADDEEREILSKNNETAEKINKQINQIIKEKKLNDVNEIMNEAEKEKEKLLKKWSKDTAKKLLKREVPVDVIADVTYLTEKEAEALK